MFVVCGILSVLHMLLCCRVLCCGVSALCFVLCCFIVLTDIIIEAALEFEPVDPGLAKGHNSSQQIVAPNTLGLPVPPCVGDVINL